MQVTIALDLEISADGNIDHLPEAFAETISAQILENGPMLVGFAYDTKGAIYLKGIRPHAKQDT